MTSQNCVQEPPLACLSQVFFSESRRTGMVDTEALKEAQ